MKSRIGFVSYAPGRPHGGIGRYSHELLRALRAREVPVVELRTGRGQPRAGVINLPGSDRLPGLLSLGQAQIALAARRAGLDLVYDPTGTLPILLAGVRRVATIHDVIPYVYPRASTLLDRLIYRFWLPVAVRQLDAVITVSEQSKADIIRYLPVNPDNVVVIPNGVDGRFRVTPERESRPVLDRYGIVSPFILYVGSLALRKNLERLIDAYAQLRRWSQRWTLVVVGAQSWNKTAIFEKVQELELLPSIHFTGFIADPDLPALYSGADLFVFPSLYEGFGIPVLEAMACGTPVVTSNCTSLPSVAGDAAVLVDPTSAESISSGMRHVLENPALAESLRSQGLVRARDFTWEKVAQEVTMVYERVIDGPVRRQC